MKDYYKILEISQTASEEVVKAAYKSLVKKYHPDNGSNGNESYLVQINEAYEVLSNPEKRLAYDKQYKKSCKVSQSTYTHDEENIRSNYDYSQLYHDFKEKNRNFEYTEEIEDEEEYVEDKSGNTFSEKAFRFLKKVGKELYDNYEKSKEIVDYTYKDGMSLSERSLVRKYKDSSGARRVGYKRALQDRGLLVENSQGEVKATSRFVQLYQEV